MPTPEEHEAMIQPLGWPELQALWERIKIRDTPGWGRRKGKALPFDYNAGQFEADLARQALAAGCDHADDG